MGSFSIWHWLVVLAVILVLFGGGNKISGVMGDFAKGIKAFKKNMAEPDDVSAEEHASRPPGSISGPAMQNPAQSPRETASAQTTREHSTTS